MEAHVAGMAAWQPREVQKKNSLLLHNSFFSLKGVQDRPVSVATEFMESDFDDEILSDYDDGENSPRVSLQSGQPSFTTASSFDEIQTPRSSRMPMDYPMMPTLPMEQVKQQVEGPHGPHLFRISTLSAEFQNALTLSPITPQVPKGSDVFAQNAAALPLGITPLPSRNKTPSSGPFRFTADKLDMQQLVAWSPEQVAQWMLNAGIELQVCERFVENDITGGILITLKFEDLKELGIPSFGVRTTVWNQINVVKNVPPPSETLPETPIEDVPDRAVRRERRHDHHEHENPPQMRRRPSSRRKKSRLDEVVTPLESVSIVGIEQMMPKPHQCSKGENCSKWKRNQRMIEAFRREHPFANMDKGGIVMIAGDPGNPETARALFPHVTAPTADEDARPISDMVPSVVASSDVMGPGVMPPTQALHEDTLRTVQSRDPQDNVRQFLDFQHQHGATGSEVPPTPPFELYPGVVQQQARAAPIEGLRGLPRLTIPTQTRRASAAPAPARQSVSPPATTPSAAPTSGTSYTHTAMEESPERTPHAFYRFGTPFSEMDVPVTAVPIGPVGREVSQSVPPNMNYRGAPTRTMSRASARRPSFPVLPALDENQATAVGRAVPGSHQRSPSATTLGRVTNSAGTVTARPLQPPPRVRYPWSPERSNFETAIAPMAAVLGGQPASRAMTSASSSSSSVASASTLTGASSLTAVSSRDAEGITYQGLMKKRKTKMLRHEWHDRFVTLRGTRLAMHKDAASVGRTLEYIDIDDYAIACSSIATTSKLNAAFKAMNIRRGSDDLDGHKAADVAAFSFQLIPQDARGGMRLRKRESTPPPGSNGVASLSLSAAAAVGASGASAAAPISASAPTAPPPPPADAVNGTGKTHHFAVKSRDERIEWMRELMLAKAMRQKGEGFEVRVNGNMI